MKLYRNYISKHQDEMLASYQNMSKVEQKDTIFLLSHNSEIRTGTRHEYIKDILKKAVIVAILSFIVVLIILQFFLYSFLSVMVAAIISAAIYFKVKKDISVDMLTKINKFDTEILEKRREEKSP